MEKKCTVEDCNRKHRAKGLCAKHYNNSKGYSRNRGPGRTDYGVCVVKDCEIKAGPTRACRKHWHTVNRPLRNRTKKLAKYGLTIESFEILLASQGYACKICKSTIPGGQGNFHIDHNHKCCPGQYGCPRCIRGLLCARCNVALGMARDSIEVLQAMIEYLSTPTPVDRPEFNL